MGFPTTNGTDDDGVPLFIPAALDPTPTPDPTYVNITLQIDPNWPHLTAFASQPIQLLFNSLTVVFCTLGEEGLTEQATANYATSDVLGRAEQYKTFTGTGNREISMTFHFVTQGSASSGGSAYAENQNGNYVPAGTAGTQTSNGEYTGTGGPFLETVQPARWLESLKFPIPNSSVGLSYAPPPLILTVGKLLAARVALTEADIRWMPPFEPGTMYPFGAEVRCQFTVVRAVTGYDAGNYAADTISQFLTFPPQGDLPANYGQ